MTAKRRLSIVVPLLASVAAATAVVLLWQGLRYDRESKIAQVTEAASYASRSELARQLILQFSAFRGLADFWADSIRGQRGVDNSIPLTLFAGVDLIGWDQPGGARFLTDGASPVFDHVPSEAEWAPLLELLPDEQPQTTQVLGPEIDAEGHALFSFVMPARRLGQEATLVGIIDAHDALEAYLRDDAPGYDIRVTCCDGVELYRRGPSDADVPEVWTRGGWIEPERGLRWNVRHRPSEALIADLTSWAIDAVLVVGLAMSMMLGALIYQSRVARNRAAAASTAERDVRVLNRNLEDQVELRTQDLNEVLADLNTINLSVSHDLRSPLNAISLLAQSMQMQPARSENDQDRFARIAANVKRMSNIMDRLFGFSRATSFEYSIERVDMRELAQAVAAEHEPPAGTRIDIGALPPAQADETMVQILLTNLVGNALKHGAGSKIEIGHMDMDGESVYFVRDDGPGFESELAEELFKPMKRLSASKNDGLGLGLTIAARIAKRHGGRIWAEGEPGRGACFYFTLATRESAHA